MSSSPDRTATPAPARATLRALTLLGAMLGLAACHRQAPADGAVATARGAEAAAAATALGDIPACPAGASVMEGWNDRAPPRRIFGNTWYVGTCGLAAVLVTSDQGHVLIDGGTTPAGPLIEANIRTLGFDPRDVTYLLNSHEHYDHAAGLAHLQAATGAPLLARAPAVATLRNGRSDRNDPQYLEEGAAFPPVAQVRAIGDDEVVRVGPLALTAHATPGHTPGGTSWTWRSCDAGRCLDIAYTDSVSAISDAQYRYIDHPRMVEAFRRGLDRLAALPCDVHVTPHPLGSDLFARLQNDAASPLVDAGACRRYAQQGRINLDKRLAEEAAGRAP